MPAHKVVSQEEIVRAALDILRKSGSDAINARNIAKKLGCSTQPIYRIFGGMGKLEQTLEQTARNVQTAEVEKYIRKSKYPPYIEPPPVK